MIVGVRLYIGSSLILQPRGGFHIWKMHMVKGEEGLGIQVAGGRGSKRCVLGVIITHVEEGGDIHRCPTPPFCFVLRVKLPLD